MRKLFLTLCLIGAASLALAAVQQQGGEAEDSRSMTGEIVALNKDTKDLTLKEPGEEGETETFEVDEAKVPGWYMSFAVGDVVSVTFEERPEQGRMARRVDDRRYICRTNFLLSFPVGKAFDCEKCFQVAGRAFELITRTHFRLERRNGSHLAVGQRQHSKERIPLAGVVGNFDRAGNACKKTIDKVFDDRNVP